MLLLSRFSNLVITNGGSNRYLLTANPMKQTILFFAIIIILPAVLFSQKTDTIRTHNYSISFYQLELTFNPDSSFIFIGGLFSDTLVGKYRLENNCFTLEFDTTRFSRYNRKFLQKITTQVKFCQSTSWDHSPLMIIDTSIYFLEKNEVLPKAIAAVYNNGNGFHGFTIDLQPDSSYSLTDWSEGGGGTKFTETGKWKMKNNLILFLPKENSSMLDWHTQENKFIVIKDFIIGKKVTRTKAASGQEVITELFTYFIKAPVEN